MSQGMICNHCTGDDRSSWYYLTRNGWICNECRDEIIAAIRTPNDPPGTIQAAPRQTVVAEPVRRKL